MISLRATILMQSLYQNRYPPNICQGEKPTLYLQGNDKWGSIFSEIYPIKITVSHAKLCYFSKNFTHILIGSDYRTNLVYLDSNGQFKARGTFSPSNKSYSSVEPENRIENSFGLWEGYAFHLDLGFYFESYSGSKLRAFPRIEKEWEYYDVEILPSEGRTEYSYSDFFERLVA